MKKSMNLERKKMDNHYVFTEKCFEKLLSCFSDGDEITAFLVEYKNLFSITFKLSEELHGPELSDKEQTMILFKMLVSITMFFRNNIEIINEMIKNLDVIKLDENELEKLKESGEIV